MTFLVNDRTARTTIGGVTLRVTRSGNDPEGRTGYHWQINGPGWVEGGSDLSTGVGMDPGPVAMLATLCSFLEACAESRDFHERTGLTGENADLFPANVGEWAQQWSDELGMVRYEIEEGRD